MSPSTCDRPPQGSPQTCRPSVALKGGMTAGRLQRSYTLHCNMIEMNFILVMGGADATQRLIGGHRLDRFTVCLTSERICRA